MTIAKNTTDSRKVTATLASLDVEADLDAFTFGIKNKIITFPNPGDMPWDDAQAFMEGMEGADTGKVLALWLSEEDHKVLMDAKLTLFQMRKLIEMVIDHYQNIFGTPPKENA